MAHCCYGYACFHIQGCVFLLQGDPASHDPVLLESGVTYLFIQHNVYVMTASRQNCNAASLLLFLHRIVDVCTSTPYGR
jgi:hypothetical protein